MMRFNNVRYYNYLVAIIIIITSILLIITADSFVEIGAGGHGDYLGAKAWPQALCILLIVLSLAMVVETIVLKEKYNQKEYIAPFLFKDKSMKLVYALCGILVISLMLMELVGFRGVIPWVTLSSMLLLGERRWWILIVSPILMTVSMYFIFDYMLHLRLP